MYTARNSRKPEQDSTERTPLVDTKVKLDSVQQKKQVPDHKEKTLGEISVKKILTFCAPYIVPRTTRLRIIGVVSVLCTIGYKACLLLPGFSMKIAVDGLASKDEKARWRQPILGAIGYFLGRMFAAVFGQGQDIALEYCSQQMTRHFATASFGHLQSLSLSYHTTKKTGTTTSILGRGIGSIQVLMRLLVFFLSPTILEALVVSGIFFRLGSPWIALFTVLTVVIYVLYTGYITKWRVKYGRKLREAENEASGRATETIMNFSTVKSFGMECAEVQRYDSLRAAIQDVALTQKGVHCAYVMGQNFIVQVGTVIGLLIAAREAFRGNITAGDFVLVQAYIGQLFGPLLWLGTSYGQVISALTNVEQVMELFATIPEVQDAEGAIDLSYDESELDNGRFGSVTFDNVSFRYNNDEENSGGVQNLSFNVPAGKMVALVGPSGAGKSTVGRLLLRLYDTDEGRVLVDGHDVRLLTQNSLRRSIGLVAQDTILFNDTLRNNIAYGMPEATDAQVWEAVQLASLEDFVGLLPEGLDTITGERGVRLSGGERQRVGIARAVLKRPAIIMLDEATSALSSIDEKHILENLKHVCKGRTTLAIAHRLSTVMRADEILVVSSGKIVERGPHQHLVSLGGVYARMWCLQAGEESTSGSE